MNIFLEHFENYINVFNKAYQASQSKAKEHKRIVVAILTVYLQRRFSTVVPSGVARRRAEKTLGLRFSSCLLSWCSRITC